MHTDQFGNPVMVQGIAEQLVIRTQFQGQQPQVAEKQPDVNPMNQSTEALIYLFNYLFGVLCRFQHCKGHITTGNWKGRGNQYIQFVRVLYCKLPTKGKQLPAFPL